MDEYNKKDVIIDDEDTVITVDINTLKRRCILTKQILKGNLDLNFTCHHLNFLLCEVKQSSPLNPLCQMNPNLLGNIIGRSSIKIAHLVPIR